MNIRKMFFITIVILIFLLSCTKKEQTYKQYDLNGIRITENSTTPADSTFRIELKEVGFIDMENETDTTRFISRIGSMDMDAKGSLYIMDGEKSIIHKYDKDCNFVRSFGRKGKGPGEFWLPGFINVRKDTIFISNWTSLDIIKYDTDGNYLSYKKGTEFNNFPSYPKKSGENYIQSSSSSNYSNDKGMIVVYDVSIYDKNFNFVKDLFRDEYHTDWRKENDPSENGYITAASDSVIFVYKNSKDKYLIELYNSGGIKKGEIRKNYKRTKAVPEQQAEYDEMNKKYGTNYKILYANSITDMKTGKYGRLWVNSSNNRSLTDNIFDVFENGIFINSVHIELEEGYVSILLRDKIIAVNKDNNNIKVYDY